MENNVSKNSTNPASQREDLVNKVSIIEDQMNFWQLKIEAQDIENRIKSLETQSHDENLWDNPDNAKEILQELSESKEMYSQFMDCKNQLTEIKDMLNSDDISELIELIIEDIDTLHKMTESWYIKTLFSSDLDDSACYMEFHAGAGGTESQDWAGMLLRMYTMFANKRGYQFELIDQLIGEEAGIKSATIKLTGKKGSFPYGWLKSESGVHRLVRISPFDSNGKRHTSFASVYITPLIDTEIKIEIDQKDLRIDTYRASGAGGQHVNKTDSAVRITHIPSGIITQCQNDRSQHKNKEQAMSMLKSKLYALEQAKQQEAAQEGTKQKDENAWGSQIRSYVLEPYQLAKDHRTNHSTSQTNKVLDGEIDQFLIEYLKQNSAQQQSTTKS